MDKHLKQGPRASLQPARGLGRQAVAIGLETLDLARIHENALAPLVLPKHSATVRKAITQRAKAFFTEALTPIEKTHRAAQKANIHLNHLSRTLGRRSIDLVASNRRLNQRIVQRKVAEKALQRSGNHCATLLRESRQLQKHLRRLTHRILSAQEDKRTKISRDLHDEIAQTLLGLNVRLLTLKNEAAANATGLKKEIASTQRLVKNSVKIINRFAREFGNHHET